MDVHPDVTVQVWRPLDIYLIVKLKENMLNSRTKKQSKFGSMMQKHNGNGAHSPESDDKPITGIVVRPNLGLQTNGHKRIVLICGNRCEHESNTAVLVCNDWLRLGHGRSYYGLMRYYKQQAETDPNFFIPVRKLSTLYGWSSDFQWWQRAEEYDARMEGSKNEMALKVFGSGLSLSYNRAIALKALAEQLERDLQGDKRWVLEPRQIGYGKSAEKVLVKVFNHQLLREYRGVLEDLAKETGGRTKQMEIAIPGLTTGAAPLLGKGSFSLPAHLIGPSFFDVYRDIRNGANTEYVLGGGRGSLKSTFVSEVIIELLMNNPDGHALVCRQVANTLRDSVYAQFAWSINELGLQDQFKMTMSPMQMEYLPTHQMIFFRGADDPGKLKSLKPPFGSIKILWLEELDQYRGQEAVRKIEQSVFRGSNEAWSFKSFNPPRTSGNWANKYILLPKPRMYVHRSTYLTVPPEWLGEVFINEAETLKELNYPAYEHEYLGVVNGTGGQVFDNVEIRKITDAEIKTFERPMEGMDFGWWPDPLAWVKTYHHSGSLTLYIFDEYKAFRKRNSKVWKELLKAKKTNKRNLIIADSASPKDIGDFKAYGANMRGAEKGPDSLDYSIKWLQSRVKIVIDPERCPESATEFTDYEMETDKDGEYISEYPDKNDHFIAGARYSQNLLWRRRGK